LGREKNLSKTRRPHGRGKRQGNRHHGNRREGPVVNGMDKQSRGRRPGGAKGERGSERKKRKTRSSGDTGHQAEKTGTAETLSDPNTVRSVPNPPTRFIPDDGIHKGKCE